MSKEEENKEKVYVTVTDDGIESSYKYENYEEWHQALQESPNKEMIKERKIGHDYKKKQDKFSRYVPITIQEAISDVFFRECDIVDISTEIYTHTLIDYDTKKPYQNSQLMTTVTLSILPNYPYAEHRLIKGISSKPIQNKVNSLEYNSPATVSSAKSNALTQFANLFGKNLNRDFNDNYSFTRKKEENEKSK